MKAFVSWSGGKETSLSCYKAMQEQDIEVAYLLNMISEDGRHSRSHGIKSDLLKSQAQAMGIPIVQKRTTWETYEEEFKKAVSDFKKENIRMGVFGDIDLQEHRDWVEKVCKDIDIRPVLPLWKAEREELLKEFIQAGFKATVVAVRDNSMDKEWLGRQISNEFINDLKTLGNIDLCGEKGEYHTFVTNGPLFKKGIEITKAEKILKDGCWFLDILDWEIV